MMQNVNYGPLNELSQLFGLKPRISKHRTSAKCIKKRIQKRRAANKIARKQRKFNNKK